MNAPRDLIPVGELDRSSYIGGNDVAAIMGVSPWRTPLDVYLQKTGQLTPAAPDPKREKRYRRGKLMEPVVLEMMRQDFGITVTATNQRYADQQSPFIATEIDFEWHDDVDPRIRNGEIKTVHPFAAGKWGDEGTEEVPVEYAAQSMLGLMVTGRELCQYGVLFGSDNLVLYQVARDEETIAAMRAAVDAFWHDHVLARVPPPPRTLGDLKQLYPRDTQSEITADDSVEGVLAAFKTTLEQMRKLTASRDELEFQLKSFIGDKRRLISVVGDTLATLAEQTRTSIDEKALKATNPEVYHQFMRTTTFRVLRAK